VIEPVRLAVDWRALDIAGGRSYPGSLANRLAERGTIGLRYEYEQGGSRVGDHGVISTNERTVGSARS
jgi:hypothetical protein